MVSVALGLAVALGSSVNAANPASTTGVRAAESSTAAGEPDAARVDAIIRKLEGSGALDAAVERAINRYVQRKEQAREAEEKDRAKNARPVDVKVDHIRGNAAAEVSLIDTPISSVPSVSDFTGRPSHFSTAMAGGSTG